MKITSKDILWNYAGIIMKVGINVFLFPLVIGFLTYDEIGMWTVFSSISGIVILFDMGFATTLARNVAYAWSGADELKKTQGTFIKKSNTHNLKLLKTTLKTCRYIYMLISLLALLFMLTFGLSHIKSIGAGPNQTMYIYSWLIYSAAIFLNLYYGYFTSFLYGVGAIAENNKAGVISKLIQLMLSFALLKMGYGLMSLSIAYLISGLVLRLLSQYYFYNYEGIGKMLKEQKIDLKFDEVLNSFLTIWHNAWRDGLVSLTNYIMLQANTLILSFFSDLANTGIYGMSLQLVNIIGTLSMTFYGTYQPKMQELYILNKKKESEKIFSLSIIVYILVFIMMSIGLIIVGLPIIKLLKPDINFDISMLIWMCVFMFIYRYHNLYSSYVSNSNRIPYVKSYITSAVVSMAISIVILKYSDLGIWSFIISGIGINLIYNFWRWPLFVFKELGTNYKSFHKLGFIELRTLIYQKIGRV